MDNEVVVDVKSCSRCGGDHKCVFKKLAAPIVIFEEVFPYWCLCPNTKEPIILSVTEQD